eukprot:5611187-Prymnesium_polylepis.1
MGRAARLELGAAPRVRDGALRLAPVARRGRRGGARAGGRGGAARRGGQGHWPYEHLLLAQGVHRGSGPD